MINLIPPHAKKHLLTEYWLRVLSVWLFVWSFILVVGVVALFPSWVFIEVQMRALVSEVPEEVQKIDAVGITRELEFANQQAKHIIDATKEPRFSSYLDMFETLRGESINLSEISIVHIGDGFEPVKLVGTAEDRRALAAFRDRLKDHPQVGEVMLPISNLAEDRDIQFNITVTLVDEDNQTGV